MRPTTVTILCLLLFPGCARIPEPVGYEYTTQPKMQAAYHWVVLASDLANRINNQLILGDYARTPVYVRASCGDEDTPCSPQDASTFTEAFRDILITELVSFGVPVRQTPDDDTITVHYKVQLVYHHANRLRTIYPGMLTSLTAGIMVLRNAPHQLQTIAAAGLVDFMNASSVMSSHNEVIITTSMIAKEKYLFRASDIYYINDKDSGHYRNISQNRATEIPLVGPGDRPVKPAMASPPAEATLSPGTQMEPESPGTESPLPATDSGASPPEPQSASPPPEPQPITDDQVVMPGF